MATRTLFSLFLLMSTANKAPTGLFHTSITGSFHTISEFDGMGIPMCVGKSGQHCKGIVKSTCFVWQFQPITLTPLSTGTWVSKMWFFSCLEWQQRNLNLKPIAANLHFPLFEELNLLCFGQIYRFYSLGATCSTFHLFHTHRHRLHRG